MARTNGARIVRGFTIGLTSGLAASWVMNRFQAMLSKTLEGREKPHGAQSIQEGLPNHGAGRELQEQGKDDPNDNAAERTANFIAHKAFDRDLSKEEKRNAGEIAHYAFGGITGALYGAATEVWPDAGVGVGVPFGAAVWIAADEIAVPVMGLSKPAQDYPLSKHAYALASHLVYGATAELSRRAVRQIL